MTKVAFVIQIKFKKKIEYVGYDINILGTVNNVVWDQKCGMIFSSSVHLLFHLGPNSILASMRKLIESVKIAN